MLIKATVSGGNLASGDLQVLMCFKIRFKKNTFGQTCYLRAKRSTGSRREAALLAQMEALREGLSSAQVHTVSRWSEQFVTYNRTKCDIYWWPIEQFVR